MIETPEFKFSRGSKMKRLKKYCILAVLLILCAFCLSSCGVENKNYEQYQPTQGSMFICIESYEDPHLGNIKILVDKETKIMYMYAIKNHTEQESSCITVIYDSKGQPKKYSGVITN